MHFCARNSPMPMVVLGATGCLVATGAEVQPPDNHRENLEVDTDCHKPFKTLAGLPRPFPTQVLTGTRGPLTSQLFWCRFF